MIALKLCCQFVNLAVNFNLRQYNEVAVQLVIQSEDDPTAILIDDASLEAGAYTRPLFGSTQAFCVGQGVHLGVV